MNALRFLIIYVALVVEGGLASLSCMALWALSICGIGVTVDFGNSFGGLVCLLGHSHEYMCLLICSRL